jgi:hypothetical protein
MKTLRVLALLLGLLSWSPSAFGGLLLPFNSDSCAWNATHIVVVTEGEKIDGVVTVLESWKGDLKKGDVLTIPELAAFAPAKERTVGSRLFKKAPDPPIVVSGSRIVLFLTKELGKEEAGQPEKVVWKPATKRDEWQTSAAWIEGEKVYAFAQELNPGPRDLFDWNMSERELRDNVNNVIATKTELAKLLAKPDPDKLADSIPPFLRNTKSWYARRRVLETLAQVGPASLPALRRILKDDALASERNNAVWAMQYVGGEAAGTALTEVLKEELVYWKTVGPVLKKGWWAGTGIKAEEKERLHERYSQAYTALHALKHVQSPVCREAVTEFRKYWLSLPQLSGEVAQLSDECDAVLKELRQP